MDGKRIQEWCHSLRSCFVGWLLVFPHFPGTEKDRQGQCWRTWGLSGTPGGWAAGPPAQVPAHHQIHMVRLSHPEAFQGPRGSGCSPAQPLPLHGSHRDPPASGSVVWVSFDSILHYQTSLALSIGNFYNSLLGWKRWLQQTQIRNKLYNNFTFFLQRKTVWQELWKHLLPMSSQQGL